VRFTRVQRCVERALASRPMAALDDCPRPGKELTTAKKWVFAVRQQNLRPLDPAPFATALWKSTRQILSSNRQLDCLPPCCHDFHPATNQKPGYKP
jgi:hypothetical protein